MVVDVTEYHG